MRNYTTPELDIYQFNNLKLDVLLASNADHNKPDIIWTFDGGSFLE